MSNGIVKFNEASLLAAGMPKDVVEALRHVLTQTGKTKGAMTLPEVADVTDAITPIVDGLFIPTMATNSAIGDLDANASDTMRSDANLLRRIDELAAELEVARNERASLARAVSDLQDQFGINEQPVFVETAASIKAKLGISVLSGSNTGDQTLASLGAAAVAGSSGQNFATAALTASADSTINDVKIGKSGTANFYVDANNTAVRAFSAAAGAGIFFQNSAGTVTWSFITVLGLTVTAGFGCNGKTPQTAFALGAAATDLATVITLANNLRTMAINNGMGS